jgi:hypothetical protein
MGKTDENEPPIGVIVTGLSNDTPAGTPPFFTRSAVASALQVSVTTVRRWEGTILHPDRGPDGIHRFNPKEVDALARSRPAGLSRREESTPGEIAAAAFALFKKGVDPRDVVIELEQPPEVVKNLEAEWHLMADRLVLDEETVNLLDRMAGSRLIDGELLTAIYNGDNDWIRDHIGEKLSERRRAKR